MNTTIKFTVRNGVHGSQPIIKIVQHESVFENDLISTSEQVNPIDILAREFLSPEFEARNRLFTEELHLCMPVDNPTHRITTLVPIAEKDIAKELRWELMKRYIPDGTRHYLENNKHGEAKSTPYDEVFRKFNEFFDYVDSLEKPQNKVLATDE